jgi:hypothetical protein
VAALQLFLHRVIPDGNLRSANMISSQGPHSTLEVANRYFTPNNVRSRMEPHTLSTEIDPHGYMANAAKDKYVHCEENVVRYYTTEKIDEDNYRYLLSETYCSRI